MGGMLADKGKGGWEFWQERRRRQGGRYLPLFRRTQSFPRRTFFGFQSADPPMSCLFCSMDALVAGLNRF